jgi:hypothetical protein
VGVLRLMLLNRCRHQSRPARSLVICLDGSGLVCRCIKSTERMALSFTHSSRSTLDKHSRHVLDAPLAHPRRALRARPRSSAQLHRILRRLVRGGRVCGREHVVADPQAGRVRPRRRLHQQQHHMRGASVRWCSAAFSLRLSVSRLKTCPRTSLPRSRPARLSSSTGAIGTPPTPGTLCSRTGTRRGADAHPQAGDDLHRLVRCGRLCELQGGHRRCLGQDRPGRLSVLLVSAHHVRC